MNKRHLWTTLLALAAISAAGCDQRGAVVTPLDKVIEVGQTLTQGEDRVTLSELAEWIIGDTRDFELIDLRSADQYQAGHIDAAANHPLMGLLESDVLGTLPADKRLIVYASDTVGAAQAAVLLRVAGFNAYALDGGYPAWRQRMTDPSASTDGAALSAADQAKQQAVACYFEGDYVAAAGLTVKAPAAAGYSPAVTPVVAEPEPDTLGLGLGLGLGEGLGDDDDDIDMTKLKIGEGC